MSERDLKWGFLPRSISRDQARDTGMALTLLALLLARFFHVAPLQGAAIVLLVLTMVVPAIFTLPGYAWFGLSNAIGAVTSKIVLGVLFFVVFTPIGLLRRALGHDSMKRFKWNADRASAFVVRDHTFTSSDLDRPY